MIIEFVEETKLKLATETRSKVFKEMISESTVCAYFILTFKLCSHIKAIGHTF